MRFTPPVLPSITCPRCAMTSWLQRDIEEGWCAYCNWWTSEPTLGQLMVDGEHRSKCSRPECIGCQVDINKKLPS